ncbi:MAG: 1-acyl-sn-glycerol-3-phosphate acyltransferase [Proteobacteria bacterium]|nr:1-acyl-sn-glycerol-3-phosphate acyltransferase [Pseudomonadota bacterium]
MTPHIDAESEEFPGDPGPQPPFGFRDSVRSAGYWVLGLSQFATWIAVLRVAARFTDIQRSDVLLKRISRSIPSSLGIDIIVRGAQSLDQTRTYVYVANHVNIFDMFALYQAIPQYTRALELIDHFSWPLVGRLITGVGQIPVDPNDLRLTAKGLRAAREMLVRGDSLTVLPEGSRTLDGSLGPFLPGAFRLAIKAQVPIVPIAIRGGRSISRRGDWRIRPGREEVLLAAPVSTEGLKGPDTNRLAEQCRQIIIDLLHGRRAPGS